MQSSNARSLPAADIKTAPLPARSSHAAGDALKRLVDILAALLGLALLWPVFLLLALLVKRDSPGPVFYRGPRLGRGGRPFKILKFRTMYESPESYAGPRVTAQGDARVTPFGQWLRDSKLNELPQLWNVLSGEMSLVGPRPEDPELAAGWPALVRSEVLSVRPGITSPASVLYRHEENLLQGDSLMDNYLDDILPSKLRLDQLYVRNRSFWLDLDIILWTFLVLMPNRLAEQPPAENIFLGPLSKLMNRYVSWFIADTLVTLIAIGVVGVFWRSFGPLNVGLGKSIVVAVGFAMLYSLTGAFMGVNRISWSQSNFTDALDLLPAVGLATLIALVINFFWQTGALLPPALVLMGAAVASFGFVVVRYRQRLLRTLAARWLAGRPGALDARERVLVIGGGEAGQFVAWWLQSGRAGSAFRVVGYVDDDLYKQDMRIRGANVLGRREDIAHLVREYDVGIILFAIHNIPHYERECLLEICQATHARVVQMPDMLSTLRKAMYEREADSVVANHKEYKKNSQTESENALSAGTLNLSTVPRRTSPDNSTDVELPAAQVGGWLAELDQRLQHGDYADAQEYLHSLRSSLYGLETPDASASNSKE